MIHAFFFLIGIYFLITRRAFIGFFFQVFGAFGLSSVVGPMLKEFVLSLSWIRKIFYLSSLLSNLSQTSHEKSE